MNEIEVCGQKSHGRTNGDIKALADARRALENHFKGETSSKNQFRFAIK